MIHRLSLPRQVPILDLGAGTGANMRMLKDLGFLAIRGLDSSDFAIRFCDKKGLGVVDKADVCQMPYADETFHFVLAADMLEHVANDLKALKEIWRVLQPGGCAVITVPAFQYLWGVQDLTAQHHRRYDMKHLRQAAIEAGFDCLDSFYFNYLLFTLILIVRKLVNLFHFPLENENRLNSPWINELLKWIFYVDVETAPFVRPLVGVSILLIVRKS